MVFEVRLVRSLNSHDFRKDYPIVPAFDPAFGEPFSNDIPSLLNRTLSHLGNMDFGEITKDKLGLCFQFFIETIAHEQI